MNVEDSGASLSVIKVDGVFILLHPAVGAIFAPTFLDPERSNYGDRQILNLLRAFLWCSPMFGFRMPEGKNLSLPFIFFVKPRHPREEPLLCSRLF